MPWHSSVVERDSAIQETLVLSFDEMRKRTAMQWVSMKLTLFDPKDNSSFSL